jgi:hypothetical protein
LKELCKTRAGGKLIDSIDESMEVIAHARVRFAAPDFHATVTASWTNEAINSASSALQELLLAALFQAARRCLFRTRMFPAQKTKFPNNPTRAKPAKGMRPCTVFSPQSYQSVSRETFWYDCSRLSSSNLSRNISLNCAELNALPRVMNATVRLAPSSQALLP